MWLAVLAAVLSASGTNIGKALQKQGTDMLPRLQLSSGVLAMYFSNKKWITGFMCDIGGAGLMLYAVANAPVSIVQPVAGCGLAILALYSYWILDEELSTSDCLAILATLAGTIGVGVSSEEDNDGEIKAPGLWALGILAVGFGVIQYLFSYYLTYIRKRVEAGKPSLHPRMDELVSGAQAGIFFGMSAAVSRLGFVLAQSGSPPNNLNHHIAKLDSGRIVWESQKGGLAGVFSDALVADWSDGLQVVENADSQPEYNVLPSVPSSQLHIPSQWRKAFIPISISLSVILSSCGFVCQTKAFKGNRAIAVATAAATSAILTGVIVGIFFLGEPLPSSSSRIALRLFSWGLLIFGVACLTNPAVSQQNSSATSHPTGNGHPQPPRPSGNNSPGVGVTPLSSRFFYPRAKLANGTAGISQI